LNIVFLVPYVPNLIRVRPYNLIRGLNDCGHNIKLITLWSSNDELESIKEIEKYCVEVKALYLPKLLSYWNCVKALPSTTPLQAVYCWNPSLADYMVAQVENSIENEKTDVIHVEHLRGAKYGIYLQENR